MQYIFEQPKYLTYIEIYAYSYYVIGIRNLSSLKIVTIVFILSTKKIGTPAIIYGFSIYVRRFQIDDYVFQVFKW